MVGGIGAKNVGLVFARWPDLPASAKLLLVYMAHRALDGDDHPVFYGGRQDLAVGMGRGPVTPDDEDKADAAYHAVRRAMGLLQKVGAITLIERPRRGRNAKYLLNIK